MTATATRPTSSPIVTRTRQRRVLVENLTAYLFISPALLLIFLFGIFPIGFAFFVSLHQWRRFPESYIGMAQYVRALDGFAYVLFFWLSLGALAYALVTLRRLWRTPASERLAAFSALIPGAALGAALYALLNWVTILLPIILDIPQRIRGQERVQGLFVGELVASFQFPEAASAGTTFLLVALVAGGITFAWWQLTHRTLNGDGASDAQRVSLLRATTVMGFGLAGVLLMQLNLDAIATAVAEADGSLPIWTQIILITAGVGLLVAAYFAWRRTTRADGTRSLVLGLIAVSALAVGGYVLIAELPNALANADPTVLDGLSITVMFAVGTVPFQIGIGLLLAYMLFQKIKGRSFFRVVYFLPYIMPFAATAIVFNLLFSFRPESPANHLLNAIGIADQKWLQEPTGIIRLLFGAGVPEWLSGPSVALIVIMIYTTWTYIGYDATVFLAGLGNIPNELYEAGRIDGASEWSLFRHITLPMLSPTTFFLLLIAITGTFRAFTQIWIMRTPASSSSVDTLGVYIFETVRQTTPNTGYGSALAIVLFGVILLLTLFQNRIMGRQVFYG